VTVKAGPSYQTQRLEAAESLMSFVQAVPAAGAVVIDLIATNMDWPGAQEIAKRLKKTLPPGILEPDEMEEAGIEPPKPTPEQQSEKAQTEADMAQAQADTEKAKADTEKAKADTAEAQQKMAEIEANATAAGPGSIEETVRVLVAEAMAELMSEQQKA
jgi:superfamily II DNA/RNA helicase